MYRVNLTGPIRLPETNSWFDVILQTLARTVMAITLVMTIIFVFTDVSVDPRFPERGSFHLAYWPGLAHKIEDGKYLIKEKKPYFEVVDRDEYLMFVKLDQRNVWHTYYTAAIFLCFPALPFAFPYVFSGKWADFPKHPKQNLKNGPIP